MTRPTLAALLLLTGAAADWPRFRGPNGAGTADAPPDLLARPATAKPAWTVALPGGYSSPVVVADKLFIQSAAADGSDRRLDCLDVATGKTLWTATRPGKPASTHKKNSLASGTPAADADRVYCVFWDGHDLALAAYDHTGKELWAENLGPFASQHGPGLSPVVHAGRVYLNLDQDGAAELVCIDAGTGKQIWAKPRKAFRACYTAPIVRPLPNDRAEIVVASTAGLAGHDPATGAETWAWAWPFDGMALRTVGTPVLAGDLVIAAAGDGGGSRSMVALAPGLTPALKWERHKDTPYVPSLLVKGEYLYYVTDAGIAACAEAGTGKVVWTERALTRAVSASPILAGDHVLAVAEDGQAVVFRADQKGFDQVAAWSAGGTVIATPAVADGRLFVRAGGKLSCWTAAK